MQTLVTAYRSWQAGLSAARLPRVQAAAWERSLHLSRAKTWQWVSVQFSCSVLSCSLRRCGLQHARLPGRPITNSQSLLKLMSISLWCHPTVSSSVIRFSCLQSFPASGSFLMGQSFTSSSQSIGATASASVPPMNIQDWFHLGWTGWISLQSKGLSRVFSNITVRKQFFGTQLSLWSNSHIHTWLLEKPQLRLLTYRPLLAK